MKKLLVWDGDETLWDGTILDGDIPSIPPARVSLCNELSSRGVLQSVASRNSLSAVLSVLHQYGLDGIFLRPQADLLRPKSMMIKAVMTELGLSRNEDVVFLDDLAYNRAEVMETLPGVVAFSPNELESVLTEHFTKSFYTDEDRARVRRYRDEEVRETAAASFDGNRTAFLRSCGLTLTLLPCDEESFPRVVDLVSRANRGSAMAEHYDEFALREIMPKITVGRVSDRFGDYGLSAIVGVDTGKLLLLVVSCRLQGKGIGSSILGKIINNHVGKTVSAIWGETSHNGAMRELYRWYRFSVEELSGGRVFCHKNIESPVELPDWVTVVGDVVC